jgi:hypothetical protein
MARDRKKEKPKKAKEETGVPWGRTIGLLVACIATIVGAIQGTSPAHLLYRAGVGSILACVVVNCFTRLVNKSASRRSRVRNA